jgi:hypothetical protein
MTHSNIIHPGVGGSTYFNKADVFYNEQPPIFSILACYGNIATGSTFEVGHGLSGTKHIIKPI